MTANEYYRTTWQTLEDWRGDHAARQSKIVAEYQRLAAAASKGRGASAKLDELDEHYRPLSALFAEERAQLDTLRAELRLLAEQVQPVPDGWQRLDSSHDASYGSQTQPSLYARHRLTPCAEHLERLGFRVEVVRAGDAWELWSDCPDWQYSAFRARLPLQESLACWTRHGVNVRVYLPTLPHGLAGGY